MYWNYFSRMGCVENFWWVKNCLSQFLFLDFAEQPCHLKYYFSVFYDIRDDIGIILLYLNVRKMYGNPNTVSVNRHVFLCLSEKSLSDWLFFVGLLQYDGITEIISLQNLKRGKLFRHRENSERMVTVFSEPAENLW